MKKSRKGKKPSAREQQRRRAQSDECHGVSYKGGYKFTKQKNGSYLMESNNG